MHRRELSREVETNVVYSTTRVFAAEQGAAAFWSDLSAIVCQCYRLLVFTKLLCLCFFKHPFRFTLKEHVEDSHMTQVTVGRSEGAVKRSGGEEWLDRKRHRDHFRPFHTLSERGCEMVWGQIAKQITFQEATAQCGLSMTEENKPLQLRLIITRPLTLMSVSALPKLFQLERSLQNCILSSGPG